MMLQCSRDDARSLGGADARRSSSGLLWGAPCLPTALAEVGAWSATSTALAPMASNPFLSGWACQQGAERIYSDSYRWLCY